MGKPSILEFIEFAALPRKPSKLADFWRLDQHTLPDGPGAYVLVARAGVAFDYPGGKSPVFYIGQAKSLRRRLVEHLRYSRSAAFDRKHALYWPRYEYAAKFGGRYSAITTWQKMKPRALEEELLAGFASRFKAFPVANSAGAWARIQKHARLRDK